MPPFAPRIRPRRHGRTPGVWLSVLLALAVHALVVLGLFWDAVAPHGAPPWQAAVAPFSMGMEPRPPAAVAPAPVPPPPRLPSMAPQAGQLPSAAVAPAESPVPEADIGAPLRPSFDCALARSRNEKLICSDAELARQDLELGRLYARARVAARDPIAFRRQTHDAWQRREQTCQDRACLVAWYAQRRTELNAVIAQARP